MKEENISIEIAVMPSNWITAEDAREIATSLRNTRFTELMDFIMKRIRNVSAEGAVSLAISIPGGYYKCVYEQAQAVLQALGYTVCGETYQDSRYRTWCINW